MLHKTKRYHQDEEHELIQGTVTLLKSRAKKGLRSKEGLKGDLTPPLLGKTKIKTPSFLTEPPPEDPDFTLGGEYQRQRSHVLSCVQIWEMKKQ